MRLAHGSTEGLMASAERSDLARPAIANDGDTRRLGRPATSRRRRQLVRLADVVTFSSIDFRHGRVDYAKIKNVERMLLASLSRRRGSLAVKRALDIVGAAFALLLLLPLLTLAALAVKLTTPGPIIYSQFRHGLNGRPFRIYKFRTLYADHCDSSGINQAVPGDGRITPVGRLFRRTNIDELPQLWNVLKGDMSLVGPRPHAIGMNAGGAKYEHFVLVYPMRLLVKPGITGLAQLRGFRGPTRSRTSARMRIVCDLQYVAECSNLLDVKILVLTVLRELRGGTGG
jgi:lipopolysaccharide/colanic/teichoic acid biosynthesis glycosyltransferase